MESRGKQEAKKMSALMIYTLRIVYSYDDAESDVYPSLALQHSLSRKMKSKGKKIPCEQYSF